VVSGGSGAGRFGTVQPVNGTVSIATTRTPDDHRRRPSRCGEDRRRFTFSA
jgi:hypothetical protein